MFLAYFTQPLDLSSPNKDKSWLALAGNVSCVMGFLLTCLQGKAEPWEVWVSIHPSTPIFPYEQLTLSSPIS